MLAFDALKLICYLDDNSGTCVWSQTHVDMVQSISRVWYNSATTDPITIHVTQILWVTPNWCWLDNKSVVLVQLGVDRSDSDESNQNWMICWNLLQNPKFLDEQEKSTK